MIVKELIHRFLNNCVIHFATRWCVEMFVFAIANQQAGNGVSLVSTGSCRCEHGLGEAGDYGGSSDGRRRRCVRSACAGESQRAQDNVGQVVESESSRFWLQSLVKIVSGGSLLIALFNPILFVNGEN